MATASAAASRREGRESVLGRAVVALGDWTIFSLRTLAGIFGRHNRWRTVLPVMYNVGVSSVGVVAVTGSFIGMVLAVQTYGTFHDLGMETSIGSMTNMSIVKELGPVLAAVMLAGRVGSAMAAQLATMRVTEQIDAIACLGVDPVHYLATPRFIACVLLIPLLTVLADVMGILGSSAICLWVYGIDPHHYWRHARSFVGAWDVLSGLTKTLFFGGAMALICCHRGFHSRAGAEGVGRAATQGFVLSFVAILILDFFLAMLTNSLQTLLWPHRAGVGFG